FLPKHILLSNHINTVFCAFAVATIYQLPFVFTPVACLGFRSTSTTFHVFLFVIQTLLSFPHHSIRSNG
ncbi:hypothetical protein COCCADRAFT_110832, partial [Bipolaris zeicola 26-R-13]